jgi:hypothetical protein
MYHSAMTNSTACTAALAVETQINDEAEIINEQANAGSNNQFMRSSYRGRRKRYSTKLSMRNDAPKQFL